MTTVFFCSNLGLRLYDFSFDVMGKKYMLSLLSGDTRNSFVWGHRGYKMRFWGDKNPKILVLGWSRHSIAKTSVFAIEILRVRAFFHKTVRVCHFYCNFKLGFACRSTVIFGTLKDGSLLINTLASKICFSYINMFQNGVDALSKIVDAFLSKTSKFYLVRIIWKCSNFASLWHKYLLRNYKWHFRLPMSAFATAIWNTISKHQLFTLNFAFQLFHVSIAIDNCRSQNTICNSLTTILPQAGEIWSKSDDSNYIKFWAFLQKAVSHVNHSDISLAPFWKRWVKQFHDERNNFCEWNNFMMLKDLIKDLHISLFQKLR